MTPEDKLEKVFSEILAQNLVDVYIDENDSFVMEFENGMLIELFSEDGDMSIYYEMGQADEVKLH